MVVHLVLGALLFRLLVQQGEVFERNIWLRVLRELIEACVVLAVAVVFFGFIDSRSKCALLEAVPDLHLPGLDQPILLLVDPEFVPLDK